MLVLITHATGDTQISFTPLSPLSMFMRDDVGCYLVVVEKLNHIFKCVYASVACNIHDLWYAKLQHFNVYNYLL